ncbi:MAG: ATP-binding protein, partial [Bacteroidales bacterium]|nr:ATP-binding protein [Bacteroidales bacterium]
MIDIMKIKSVHIENFRGIQSTTIEFKDFNCIVGKNDIGKSTLLKALDLFFNGENLSIDDVNITNKSNTQQVLIEVSFVELSI